MTAHIALLRAVNVGGHGKVSMADLRAFLSTLGFSDAQSLLQSGNLVFTNKKTTDLETLLEREARKRLGLETDFFVRSASEWDAVVAANPFPKEAARSPASFLVMVLKKAPAMDAIEALHAAVSGPERVSISGRHAYLVYANGIVGSRLTNVLIERKLGVRGTARNWNTVLKLQALAAGMP